MALGSGDLIECTVRMVSSSGYMMNVWQYEIGVAPTENSAVEIAEAYWNHIKATYRALAISGAGRQFDAIIVRELNNPTGELAEFSIPSAEQDGTRAAGSLGSYQPQFVSAGVRLTVGSRTTRPGQKRYGFLTEGDVAGDGLGSGFITLLTSQLDIMTASMTLGAPAELTVLDPVVVRKDVGGLVTAHQPIEGYIINPYVTSQVSRKYGRGV